MLLLMILLADFATASVEALVLCYYFFFFVLAWGKDGCRAIAANVHFRTH